MTKEMSNQRTTFDDHDPLAYDILQVLEDFIDEVGARECTAHFDKVVDGKHYLKGKNLIQKPERFTEENLIFPLLQRAFGYSIRPQPKQYAPRWPRGGGVPDFCITSIPIAAAMQNDLRFFGEVKPPKKIENAQNDMEEYLDDDLDVHAVTILTDGFEWELWIRPKGKSIADLENPYAKADLTESLKTIRTRNMKTTTYRAREVRDNIDTEVFSQFTLDSVLDTIETEFNIDYTTPER